MKARRQKVSSSYLCMKPNDDESSDQTEPKVMGLSNFLGAYFAEATMFVAKYQQRTHWVVTCGLEGKGGGDKIET
jgi:hypothetical protein